VVTDGVMTAARLTAGQLSNNTEISDQAHDSLSLNLSAQTRLGAWSLSPRLSWSRARSGLDTPLQRIAAESPEGVAYRFDLGSDLLKHRSVPVLDTRFDLTDPRELSFSRYGVRATNVEDHDQTALLAGQRLIDFRLGPLRFERLDIGAQFSDRGRDYQRRDREAAPRAGAVITTDFFDVSTPGDVFAGLIAARTGLWTAIDFPAFRAAFVLPGETDTVIVEARDLRPTGADLQNSYERRGADLGLLWADGLRRRTWPGGRPRAIWVCASGTYAHTGRRLVAGVSPSGELEVRPVSSDRGDYRGRPAERQSGHRDWIRPADCAWPPRARITRPSLADLRSPPPIPASVPGLDPLQARPGGEIDHPSPDTLFSGVGGNPDLKPYISRQPGRSRYERDPSPGSAASAWRSFTRPFDDYHHPGLQAPSVWPSKPRGPDRQSWPR
jgi:iron complex outermembrane receptor protein